MTTDIFSSATRSKLRFPSVVGPISVEDLWDLPLTTLRRTRPSLEDVGNALLQKQQSFAATSILTTTTPSPEKAAVDLAVEVIRHIVTVREAETQARTEAMAQASERARLDDIIAQREAKEMPLEKLKEQRSALGD